MQVSPGPACNATSFLQVEVWDLSRAGTQLSAAPNSTAGIEQDRADPLLGMASGVAPNASFDETDNTWDIIPQQALFDTMGYELSRPYMRIQAAFNASKPWFVSLSNLDIWTSGALDFQIRASCAAQPQCSAPDLGAGGAAPVPCSGRGSCLASGACTCEAGSGDVGCDAKVAQMAWGAAELHTLSSNDWMYWQLEVGEEGAQAIMVQLERWAGDPVLFLKPKDGGFEVLCQCRSTAICTAILESLLSVCPCT
jgi:hypothetical protein